MRNVNENKTIVKFILKKAVLNGFGVAKRQDKRNGDNSQCFGLYVP